VCPGSCRPRGQAALAWGTTSKIGVEAIKEIQGVCGIDKTGTYDEATAKAVFAKQQELHIGADGMAGASFCQRTGIIFTHEITAATVADKDLAAATVAVSWFSPSPVCANPRSCWKRSALILQCNSEFRKLHNIETMNTTLTTL
jgi:hypothetical protein